MCKQSITNLTDKIAVLDQADEVCKQSVTNLTNKIQALEGKNAELETKNEALNLTLTTMKGMIYILLPPCSPIHEIIY